jgi:hypothetical protein
MDDEIAFMKKYNVSYQCALSLFYLSSRERGTNIYLDYLALIDKYIPNFDWTSVYRGEEIDEIKKFI